jgi:hypothetical protein
MLPQSDIWWQLHSVDGSHMLDGLTNQGSRRQKQQQQRLMGSVDATGVSGQTGTSAGTSIAAVDS